ncbi:response regulator, partial [Pseudomonas simiae]|uniref:response regulator n=1 Tax=Pseudomonas simiae TaxID=321846 RepID=UPI001F2796C3
MIRVLVVDDHDLVRTGITRMLADIDGLQVVGQAESGEESLIKARELKPDVVLMDVKMPGIGGLGATTKLLRSHPDIKVVVVTVCEEDPFPTRLLQAGAAGYLTKGAGLAEIFFLLTIPRPRDPSLELGCRLFALKKKNQITLFILYSLISLTTLLRPLICISVLL